MSMMYSLVRKDFEVIDPACFTCFWFMYEFIPPWGLKFFKIGHIIVIILPSEIFKASSMTGSNAPPTLAVLSSIYVIEN